MKKAIVLLSGGLDSSTALYLAQSQGFDEIYAITFEYGQKHDKELKSAIAIAKAAGVKEHKIVNLLLNQWSGCALTDPDMEVEDGHIERQDIPSTYVPARNMVFLSVAASWADALDITDIFIGVSEVDYSGYVDCREEFIKAMENAINLGTVLGAEKKQRITIHMIKLFSNGDKKGQGSTFERWTPGLCASRQRPLCFSFRFCCRREKRRCFSSSFRSFAAVLRSCFCWSR